MDESKQLGCPECGGYNLSLAQVTFEPVMFSSDGDMECPEGITDYGAVIAISCDNCTWIIGTSDRTLPEIKNPVQSFIQAHQDAIRAELMREIGDSA